ncbi:MAG TPA: hypothetical protein VNB29_04245 [Chthoniobacterales bacterium]|nr:hypothetical protein [Chthoniobacterales bacterium]
MKRLSRFLSLLALLLLVAPAAKANVLSGFAHPARRSGALGGTFAGSTLNGTLSISALYTTSTKTLTLVVTAIDSRGKVWHNTITCNEETGKVQTHHALPFHHTPIRSSTSFRVNSHAITCQFTGSDGSRPFLIHLQVIRLGDRLHFTYQCAAAGNHFNLTSDAAP